MPKFSKKLVERIIREELVAHIRELSEKDDKEDEKKDPKKPTTQDGEAASHDKPKKPEQSANDKNTQHVDPTMTKGKTAPGSAPDAGDDAEVPDAEDPADDDLEDDGSKDGDEGDDDRGDSKIADEITGKRVQSITFEPKSKTVPGAVEVVLTFDESPEPLKIVITKTGQVKYLFHGLHDRL